MAFSVPPQIDIPEGVFPEQQSKILGNMLRSMNMYAFETREALHAQQAMVTLPPGLTGLQSAIERPIQDVIAPLAWNAADEADIPPGTVVAFNGTLQAARALRRWDVCDGSVQGVPDLRNRFLYGAGYQEDAGTLGGAASYLLSCTIADHGDHSHTVQCTATSTTCGACLTCVVFCSTGPAVSKTTHQHQVTVSISTSGIVGDALTHAQITDIIDTVPPYYSVIWIQRKAIA